MTSRYFTRLTGSRGPGAVTLAAVLLITTAACGSDNSEPETLLTGTVHIGGKTDQPGFNTFAEYDFSGFEVDLASSLGEDIGFKPKFHSVVSAEREQVLVDGSSTLVIASYSITEDRKKDVDFVGPYLETKQGFLVRKDDDSIKKIGSLPGKTVCTVENSTSEDVTLPKGVVLTTEPGYSACVEMLEEGGIDAVFTDEALLYGYVNASKVPLKVVPGLNLGGINRYGIGLQKNHQADCEKLVRALRTYLTERWATDVRAHLPALIDTYPGDWVNRFKPNVQDLNTYSSCEA